MKNAFSSFILALTVFASPLAMAETTTYQVEGMHCGGCVKMIQSKVCKLDGVEKCEVAMGQIVLTPKTGTQLTKDQVQAALSTAGEYKITNSSTKK